MTLVSYRRSLILLALAPLGPFAAGCGTDAADEPAQSTAQALVNGDTAFAWAQQSTGSFDASSSRSFNSRGGTNHITQLGTGRYRVDFPGIPATGGGDFHVSAYGGTAGRCNLSSWNTTSAPVQAYVNCYTLAGAPANSQFSVVFQRRSGVRGPDAAYAWSDQPTSPNFIPALAYQWNSTGSTVTVTRESVGQYLVTFPGQDPEIATFLHGGWEVTQVGGSALVECEPALGEAPGGGIINTHVLCMDVNNAGVDSLFTVAASQNTVNNTSAYTWAIVEAGDGAAQLFQSHGATARSCGGADQVAATPVTVSVPGGVGAPTHVHFPEMTTTSVKSNVMAFPYGAPAFTVCKVVGWGDEAGGAFADIMCFNSTGGPAEDGDDFMVIFSSTNVIHC